MNAVWYHIRFSKLAPYEWMWVHIKCTKTLEAGVMFDDVDLVKDPPPERICAFCKQNTD